MSVTVRGVSCAILVMRIGEEDIGEDAMSSWAVLMPSWAETCVGWNSILDECVDGRVAEQKRTLVCCCGAISVDKQKVTESVNN